jgi:hypothetical protein
MLEEAEILSKNQEAAENTFIHLENNQLLNINIHQICCSNLIF